MKINFKRQGVQIWLMSAITLLFVVCVSAYIVSSSTVSINEIKAMPLQSEDCPEFETPKIITVKQAPITQLANLMNVPDPIEYGKHNHIVPESQFNEIERPQENGITNVYIEQEENSEQETVTHKKIEQQSSYQMITWIPNTENNTRQVSNKAERNNELENEIDLLRSGFTSEVEKQRSARKKYYADAMKSSEEVYLKSSRIQAPKYSLPVGTIINCRLLSSISTENPGDWIVNAKVTKPVYGGHRASETWLAIPAETRIILSYSFDINYGNHSVPATANMLIFPDESFMEIPGFPAIELSGSVGLSGRVNNRWPRIITVAGITSFLGYIPMKIAESWEEQSASRHIALGVSQGVNQAGSHLLNREIVPPTLTIKENKEFGVYCNKMMVFDASYKDYE